MNARLLLLLLSLPLIPTVAEAATPRAATAHYQVTYNGISASGSMSLRPDQDGRRWTYALAMGNSVARIEQATVFRAGTTSFLPLAATRNMRYPLGSRSVTTRFDWSARSAAWTGDVKPGKAGPVPVQPGDVEPLLLNLRLVEDVAAGRPLAYRVVDNGRVKNMRYTRLANQTIQVGGRSMDAIRLFHGDGPKQTVVWLVPGAPFPARILQHEPGGDSVDLRMTSWRPA
ncbi:DUF3108 domain-containing protein [Lysobacter sp. SG-8]|uniref:DUF3108 domain-containing protein n=1 Tax=Marilutibacter penaei TaxID=2759900 RepID=A0A7W3YEE6_9GAMM|nr:DUF3108 domain-containing protein [Lysobacter penaei]MBB1088141.1 DUF3108 domain-containing protein [Lysobacter penaei]